MPVLPKHKSTKARRNVSAGARTLSMVHDIEVPPLPDFADVEWHDMTEWWWADIWASPMAPEFDASDIHGLFALAMLQNAFWNEPSTGLASEIRLQRQCFGLTPIDRRRLQWEIDRGEQAEGATRQRRNKAVPIVAVSDEPPPPSATKSKLIDWLVTERGSDRISLEAMKKPEVVKLVHDDAVGDVRDILA